MLKLKYMFENFELAKQTLQNYEYDTDRLDEALSWFRISANAVYPFFCSGELCFLRLAPAEEKNFHDIQGEIEFIQHLRACGYPAMEPIPAKNGTYCLAVRIVFAIIGIIHGIVIWKYLLPKYTKAFQE